MALQSAALKIQSAALKFQSAAFARRKAAFALEWFGKHIEKGTAKRRCPFCRSFSVRKSFSKRPLPSEHEVEQVAREDDETRYGGAEHGDEAPRHHFLQERGFGERQAHHGHHEGDGRAEGYLKKCSQEYAQVDSAPRFAVLFFSKSNFFGFSLAIAFGLHYL